MEITKERPERPLKKRAPDHFDLDGERWTLRGPLATRGGSWLAMYVCEADKNFHLTVNVRTGDTHASPEAAGLEGLLGLHVHENTVDDGHVPVHRRTAADAWLAHAAEMQLVCGRVRVRWPELWQEMRNQNFAAQAIYREALALWEETYGSDSKERGEQTDREDFQRRRQEVREIVELGKTATKMQRMNASTWLVHYEGDRLLLADQASKTLVRVYDKMGVSDEAVEAWRDWNAQAVAVLGAGALYIARPQYLIGLEKLGTDRTWIKDLPEAEYDPRGFLYTGATGYRVPYPSEKTLIKIASAAGQIKKGTPGCYRFFYKEKMYPILPGHPPSEGGLGLEEMGAWHAWFESLPVLDGAATTHLTDRHENRQVIYQRPKTWPDEPTMAAGQGKNLFRTEEDGAPRIALKSVLSPPPSRMRDERRTSARNGYTASQRAN